jgi:hypothetical protein
MAMIDFKTLQALVTGAIFQPRQAWERYRDSTPSTQTVLLGYALPVVVGTTVAAALLSFVFGTQDFWISGSGRSFVAMLREMVLGSLLGVVGLGILAGVVLVLARVFGGSGGYDRAFAMCSLVATPALVGAVPGALPWIGWLIQIAAVIYSLVLLYQAIPVFLNVEGGKRPLHFIATLVLVAAATNVPPARLPHAAAPASARSSRCARRPIATAMRRRPTAKSAAPRPGV